MSKCSTKISCNLSFFLSFFFLSFSVSCLSFSCLLCMTLLRTPYTSMEGAKVSECDKAVMYVPAKASKGQCRDRRCHILTSLSVSATSWTLLLSPFLSHSISLPSFSVLSVSPHFLCYILTVTLLNFSALYHYRSRLILLLFLRMPV